ncbi:MAG: hypothetical protein U9Q15_04350 [Patescibacteria group bacterium]|nr:hypothetical protein [Patescibacteria group bacterium]
MGLGINIYSFYSKGNKGTPGDTLKEIIKKDIGKMKPEELKLFLSWAASQDTGVNELQKNKIKKVLGRKLFPMLPFSSIIFLTENESHQYWSDIKSLIQEKLSTKHVRDLFKKSFESYEWSQVFYLYNKKSYTTQAFAQSPIGNLFASKVHDGHISETFGSDEERSQLGLEILENILNHNDYTVSRDDLPVLELDIEIPNDTLDRYKTFGSFELIFLYIVSKNQCDGALSCEYQEGGSIGIVSNDRMYYLSSHEFLEYIDIKTRVEYGSFLAEKWLERFLPEVYERCKDDIYKRQNVINDYAEDIFTEVQAISLSYQIQLKLDKDTTEILDGSPEKDFQVPDQDVCYAHFEKDDGFTQLMQIVNKLNICKKIDYQYNVVIEDDVRGDTLVVSTRNTEYKSSLPLQKGVVKRARKNHLSAFWLETHMPEEYHQYLESFRSQKSEHEEQGEREAQEEAQKLLTEQKNQVEKSQQQLEERQARLKEEQGLLQQESDQLQQEKVDFEQQKKQLIIEQSQLVQQKNQLKQAQQTYTTEQKQLEKSQKKLERKEAALVKNKKQLDDQKAQYTKLKKRLDEEQQVFQSLRDVNKEEQEVSIVTKESQKQVSLFPVVPDNFDNMLAVNSLIALRELLKENGIQRLSYVIREDEDCGTSTYQGMYSYLQGGTSYRWIGDVSPCDNSARQSSAKKVCCQAYFQ